MYVIDVLKGVDFEDIAKALVLNYGEEEYDSIRAYEEMYKKLIQRTDIVYSSDHIVGLCEFLSIHGDEYILYHDLERFDKIDLKGYKRGKRIDSYALDLSPWNEILGLEVFDATNETMPLIAAIVLYELSFYGFDEEEMTEEIDELSERVEEIKSMSIDELKSRTVSWEDLKKELGIDLESEEHVKARNHLGIESKFNKRSVENLILAMSKELYGSC